MSTAAPRPDLHYISRLTVREVINSLTASVPTMAHAEDLFEYVVARFPHLFLDPDNAHRARHLHLGDAEGWLCPVPWLNLTSGGRGAPFPLMVVGGAEVVEAPVPKPDAPPALPGRGPANRAGALEFKEGDSYFRIEYDDFGRKFETSSTSGDSRCFLRMDELPYGLDPAARPPQTPPISLVRHPDLDVRGQTPEALAELLNPHAALEACPARVLMTAPIPGGPMRALGAARNALAKALFDAAVPVDATWVVLDGLEGTAASFGATREAALEGFVQAAWRARPHAPEVRPPRPAALPVAPKKRPAPKVRKLTPPTPPGTTTFTTGEIAVAGAGTTLEWPAPDPHLLPQVLFSLPAARARVPSSYAAAGFEWIRCLGAFGECAHALRRRTETGWQIVGEHLWERLDPDALDAALSDAAHRLDPEPGLEMGCTVTVDVFVPEPGLGSKLRQAGMRQSVVFDGSWLDARQTPYAVTVVTFEDGAST